MSAPAIPSKSDLLRALRQSGEEAVASLRALPPDAFQAGRYENGWNARQILAHIASIEWTYPRLLDVARSAQDQPATTPSVSGELRRTTIEESPRLPTRTAAGGIDSYNERQVQRRADATVTNLIDEFERNRAATIAAVEAADDRLLATPIRSAGGVTGALASVVRAVAVQHVEMHVSDICGKPYSDVRW